MAKLTEDQNLTIITLSSVVTVCNKLYIRKFQRDAEFDVNNLKELRAKNPNCLFVKKLVSHHHLADNYVYRKRYIYIIVFIYKNK